MLVTKELPSLKRMPTHCSWWTVGQTELATCNRNCSPSCANLQLNQNIHNKYWDGNAFYLQQELFSSLCKSSRGNPRGHTFASVNCMSGYIEFRFSPQNLKHIGKILFANLCYIIIFESPVCRYLLWIASPDLFSTQAVGFAEGEFGSKARCRRQCRKSTRLLGIWKGNQYKYQTEFLFRYQSKIFTVFPCP